MFRPRSGMLSEVHPATEVDLSEQSIGHIRAYARCAIACRSVHITRN